MTHAAEPELTLAIKVNRLFDLFRARDASEQSTSAVAESISAIIGRQVSAAQIGATRCESSVDPDPAIIDGLIKHFAVPREYLTTNGSQAANFDKQLRLLAAARDAGVRRLALRGRPLNFEDLHEVLDFVKGIDAESAEPDRR